MCCTFYLLVFLLYIPLQDTKISDLRVLEFRRDCMQGLTNIVRKVQEKSPLKYATVRQMACLDPQGARNKLNVWCRPFYRPSSWQGVYLLVGVVLEGALTKVRVPR